MRLLLAILVACLPGLSARAADLPAPVTDAAYMPLDMDEVRLGRLLFWDPILSGNRNISCGTCHHPRFGTSDGVSLTLGEGGIGLGPDRRPDPENYPEERVPRNAPALFNLGAHEFTVLFHDGRIEVDLSRPSGFRTPLEEKMVAGFANLLSAQTMFPVLSPDEMAGHYSENDVSAAVRSGRITGDGGAWDILSKRVGAIPEYRAAFEAVGRPKIAFTDISDVIAAFVAFEWRSDTSPFDTMLRGEGDLPEAARAGMELFYGKAGCADCHSGPFQTDHAFHVMGTPQIGPGKAARFEHHQRDDGRLRVTGREEDRYAFRTPSLRNVVATAPYGHSGSHADLAAYLRHHADPVAGLAAYDGTGAVLAAAELEKDDLAGLSDSPAIAAAVRQAPVALTENDIAALLAFLGALSDPVALSGRLGIPETVPSGLPIDR